jgi:hypothetical protein
MTLYRTQDLVAESSVCSSMSTLVKISDVSEEVSASFLKREYVYKCYTFQRGIILKIHRNGST